MAAQVVTQAPINDTLVHFNAWGGGISAAIAAAGLTKTSDTGQVTWAGNVTWPNNVANVRSVYEVWQFTDALQSTAPVYIRLDYGSNVGTAASPQVWFTLGTATNGAGTITAAATFPNSVHAVRTMFCSSSASWFSSSASNIYVDSDAGSSLMIAGWNQAPGSGQSGTAGGLLVIERTRNWDGTPNGEGVFALAAAPGSGVGSYVNYRTLIIANANTFSQPAQINFAPMMMTGGQQFVPVGSTLVGTTIYCVPIFTGFTPRMHGPSKHVVGDFAYDMPANNQFSVTHYGATHTFVHLGALPAAATWTYSGSWAIDSSTNHNCGAFRIT